MPSKKSNVAKRSKKPAFEFKLWHAFLIVALVVVVGYVLVRFSHAASNSSAQAVQNVQHDFEACNSTPTLQSGSDGPCVVYLRRFFRDVMGDGTVETGAFDDDLQGKVTDFQRSVNSAFVLGTAGYPVPRSISDDQLNNLKAAGLIRSDYQAAQDNAISTDGVVGPQTWGWVNTIVYVYFCSNNGPCFR